MQSTSWASWMVLPHPKGGPARVDPPAPNFTFMKGVIRAAFKQYLLDNLWLLCAGAFGMSLLIIGVAILIPPMELYQPGIIAFMIVGGGPLVGIVCATWRIRLALAKFSHEFLDGPKPVTLRQLIGEWWGKIRKRDSDAGPPDTN